MRKVRINLRNKGIINKEFIAGGVTTLNAGTLPTLRNNLLYIDWSMHQNTKITVLDNLSNRFDVRKAIIAWRALCSSGVAMFEENKIP